MEHSEKIKFIHEHVGGEYNKLKDSHMGLTRTGIDALNEIERGIYSDCFLLHARNLIDFLSNNRGVKSCRECVICKKCQKREKQKQEDNVLALDFVKSRKPIMAKERLMPKIEDGNGENIYLYVRINKQLSHITKSRRNNTDFFDGEEFYQKIFKNIKKGLKKYNKMAERDFEIKL